MEQTARPKARRTYSRPPIAERVGRVWAELSEESFLRNFETWRDKVQVEYPDYEPVKEWIVQVTERDGVPLYDTLQPELRLTHRFARKAQGGRREFGMRCHNDGLALHLFTRPDVAHGYDALAAEFMKWIPLWKSHFGAGPFIKALLHYSNLLNPETAGPFITKDGGLELHKLLQSFLTVPGEHEAIIPPYDCTATVLLSKGPDLALTMRIYGDLETKPQPVVWVDFTVNVIPATGLETDDVMRFFDTAHERILDRFDLVFTETAKRFFSGE